MAINKVIYGNTTLMDLTSDTATEDKVMSGYTFHDASGTLRTGTASGTGGWMPRLIIETDTGSTVIITKGQTSITATETSTGVFEADLPEYDYGIYTITASLNGQTTTKTLNVDDVKQYEIDLNPIIHQTITIYSAKEDTISYTDIDGATQTITFASGATSKQVQITINPNGSSITFTSSVAKNPNNLSQDYSKTFTITASTTDIYLMPDAVKTLYWWGYESDNLEDCITANGWSVGSGYALITPTRQTNYIDLNCSGNTQMVGIGTKNAVKANTIKAIATGKSVRNNSYGDISIMAGKNLSIRQANINIASTNMQFYSYSETYTEDKNIMAIGFMYTNKAESWIHALWYE